MAIKNDEESAGPHVPRHSKEGERRRLVFVKTIDTLPWHIREKYNQSPAGDSVIEKHIKIDYTI